MYEKTTRQVYEEERLDTFFWFFLLMAWEWRWRKLLFSRFHVLLMLELFQFKMLMQWACFELSLSESVHASKIRK